MWPTCTGVLFPRVGLAWALELGLGAWSHGPCGPEVPWSRGPGPLVPLVPGPWSPTLWAVKLEYGIGLGHDVFHRCGSFWCGLLRCGSGPLVLWSPGPLVPWSLRPAGLWLRLSEGCEYCKKQHLVAIRIHHRGATRYTCSDRRPWFANGGSPPAISYCKHDAQKQHIHRLKKPVCPDLCPCFSNGGGAAPTPTLRHYVQVRKELCVGIFVQTENSYHTCTRTVCSHHRFLKHSFASSYMLLYAWSTSVI